MACIQKPHHTWLDLGIGTTWESFHSSGTIPEWLKILVKADAMLQAVFLSILPEMLSGPLALDMSKVHSISKTSSTLHNNSLRQSLVVTSGIL